MKAFAFELLCSIEKTRAVKIAHSGAIMSKQCDQNFMLPVENSKLKTLLYLFKRMVCTTDDTICKGKSAPPSVMSQIIPLRLPPSEMVRFFPLLRLPSVRSDLHRCPHLSGPDLHHKCYHRWCVIYHWYHWLTVYLTSDNLVTVSPTIRTPIVANRVL